MDTLIQLGYERQAPIEAAIAAFLASGGQVRQCGLSETQPKPISMWNSAITRRKDARRVFEQKERELAEMISDNAVMVSEYGNVATCCASEVKNCRLRRSNRSPRGTGSNSRKAGS